MKLKTGLSLLAGCASVALMAGCGSKAAQDVQQAGNNVSAAADHTEKLAEMQGTFAAGCMKATLLETIFGLPAQSEMYSYGASLQKTTTLYSDANCATPALRITENGSYNLGAKQADQVYLLDEHVNSAAVVSLNDTETAKLNAIPVPGVTLFSFCGINTWQTNVSQDVTAKTGPAATSHCLSQTPYDIADLIQIANGQVRFGDTSNGKDKSAGPNRPQTIDQTITYNKQ